MTKPATTKPATAKPAPTKPARSGGSRAPAKTRSPDATKQDIIAVATREFAQNGLSGARVDEIAAKTGSSKRMIYYYRSEEHTSELQSLMRISYAVFCLKKTKNTNN